MISSKEVEKLSHGVAGFVENLLRLTRELHNGSKAETSSIRLASHGSAGWSTIGAQDKVIDSHMRAHTHTHTHTHTSVQTIRDLR